MVGVNSDASVRSLKGRPGRCSVWSARAQVLAGLQAVDYVVALRRSTPLKLIQAVRPDVLVKGADYRAEDVIGAKFVESYGGRVFVLAVVRRVFDDGFDRARCGGLTPLAA